MEFISAAWSQIYEVIITLRNFSIAYAAKAWGVEEPIAHAILAGIVGYIIIMIIGTLLHRRIKKKLLKKREKYTWMVDELLFIAQSTPGYSGEWIQELIKKNSYEKSFDFIVHQGKDFPNQIKIIQRQHTSIKITTIFSALYGRMLTILTLGLYKLFW